jgi:hypothetical protein
MLIRFFSTLTVILAVTFISASPLRAWGCLAVTPWVNGDRSIGWGYDGKNQNSRAAVAQVAMRRCEMQRSKANPQYPRCFIAGCAVNVRSEAEAKAISPP